MINRVEVRIWVGLLLTAVLTSGAVLLAQPYPSVCSTCTNVYPYFVCVLMGCIY